MSYYKKCNVCCYVTNRADLEENNVCPKCDNEYQDTWDEYPLHAAMGFYHQFQTDVYSYDEVVALAYDFHEIQPACLLSCALYETLLTELISDILHAMNIPQNVIEIIFGTNNGQEKLTSIFKSLVGISLKESINNNYDTSFYDQMQEIIKGRNKYIHGNYTALDHISIENLLYIENNMLEVFVKLHNVYATK